MSLSDPALRAIFEDAPIDIVVVDGDVKIVDANDAYCRMLGYTEAEMKVRDPRGYWNELESYLRSCAAAEIQESLCPDCSRSGH